MAKTKTVYICQTCGAKTYRWQGKCTSCNDWNTLELQEEFTPEIKGFTLGSTSRPTPISDVGSEKINRYKIGISELDRVLGGGIVPGSLTLLAGEPGVGKSTLLLQLAKEVAQRWGRVLYISGEESPQQIKMRAERLDALDIDIYLLAENSVDNMLLSISELKPVIVIVDSIQTTYKSSQNSAPGTVTQIKESAAVLMRLAKDQGIPVFLVGHVTKQGTVAGPQVLMHMVDTVLSFTGDKHSLYRILFCEKNRFGATDEVGIFEMKSTGLKEVADLANVFLSRRRSAEPGTAIVPALEGTRPILVEIQALLTKGHGAMPRRQFTGTDRNRTSILLAVLEKRLGLSIRDSDVYINVVGGLNITEPAADLAIALAAASSVSELPLGTKWGFFGEVGLTGELRAVNQPEKRLLELSKLGFTDCMMPAENYKMLDSEIRLKFQKSLNIFTATNIFEAWDFCKKG